DPHLPGLSLTHKGMSENQPHPRGLTLHQPVSFLLQASLLASPSIPGTGKHTPCTFMDVPEATWEL
ncbi:hypothetical protein P7K49_009090, partial [Saguinus oedipus]